MGYVNALALSFYVLVRFGYMTEALYALKMRYERSSLVYLLIYSLLDSGLFSDTDLKESLVKLDNERKSPEPIEGKLKKKTLNYLRF
jgi:hypothetical protein